MEKPDTGNPCSSRLDPSTFAEGMRQAAAAAVADLHARGLLAHGMEDGKMYVVYPGGHKILCEPFGS